MKISETISGLANTLATKGDLDVFFCVKNTDGGIAVLRSLPLICGGWANNDATGEPIAFVSSEDLTGTFKNE